ncbi:MAG TPA: hypothetical protein VNN73_16210 [Blastocatellia bacterium]|nr:hypothetical protein [Blastocatellia bacterium]
MSFTGGSTPQAGGSLGLMQLEIYKDPIGWLSLETGAATVETSLICFCTRLNEKERL